MEIRHAELSCLLKQMYDTLPLEYLMAVKTQEEYTMFSAVSSGTKATGESISRQTYNDKLCKDVK